MEKLPKLQAHVKNIYFDSKTKQLTCDIYVYKDEKLHIKLKKNYEEL